MRENATQNVDKESIAVDADTDADGAFPTLDQYYDSEPYVAKINFREGYEFMRTGGYVVSTQRSRANSLVYVNTTITVSVSQHGVNVSCQPPLLVDVWFPAQNAFIHGIDVRFDRAAGENQLRPDVRDAGNGIFSVTGRVESAIDSTVRQWFTGTGVFEGRYHRGGQTPDLQVIGSQILANLGGASGGSTGAQSSGVVGAPSASGTQGASHAPTPTQSRTSSTSTPSRTPSASSTSIPSSTSRAPSTPRWNIEEPAAPYDWISFEGSHFFREPIELTGDGGRVVIPERTDVSVYVQVDYASGRHTLEKLQVRLSQPASVYRDGDLLLTMSQFTIERNRFGDLRLKDCDWELHKYRAANFVWFIVETLIRENITGALDQYRQALVGDAFNDLFVDY